jgi:hypothetical protein
MYRRKSLSRSSTGPVQRSVGTCVPSSLDKRTPLTGSTLTCISCLLFLANNLKLHHNWLLVVLCPILLWDHRYRGEFCSYNLQPYFALADLNWGRDFGASHSLASYLRSGFSRNPRTYGPHAARHQRKPPLSTRTRRTSPCSQALAHSHSFGLE